MPELPEVESVRRGLVRARVRGRVIAVWRSRARLRADRGDSRPAEGLDLLLGAVPSRVSRHGKYLVWAMAGKDGDPLGLLIHLGMSGRCGIVGAGVPRVTHTHLALTFADGRELRFVDPRRFGVVRAGPLGELLASGPIARLGPEPLARGFSGAALAAALGDSRRVLRDALLDQEAVAGVGNIYAAEALFEAGLHPLLACRRLTTSAWERLALALRRVLRRGIADGGTTLKDFRNVAGRVGRHQDELLVYGRAGQRCRRCGTTLRGFVHGGRSGVWCPVDQPRTRRARVT